MSDKSSGAKQAVQNMLFYYLTTLLDNKDPKQIIASELGAMIDLSEEQITYVNMQLNTNNKVIENFDTCIQLLDNMIKNEKIDIESLKIIVKVLGLMKDACNNTFESLDINPGENNE